MNSTDRQILIRNLGVYLADLAQALGVSVQITDQQDNSREGKWFPVVVVALREWDEVNMLDAGVAGEDIRRVINDTFGIPSPNAVKIEQHISSATSPEHAKRVVDSMIARTDDAMDRIHAYHQGNGKIVSEAEFDMLMHTGPHVIDLTAKAEMFTRVSEMNEAFGNPKGDMANIDWDRIESQVKCIPEEVDEALEAIAARDLPALRDALCDIPVFSLGAQHLAGIDGAADMDIVIDANMTRLITNADQLARTMKKYADMGLVTYVVGEFPTMALKSARTQRVPTGIGSNTADFPKDKFLKCVDFKEPVFESPAQQTLPLDEPNPMSAAMSEDAQFNGGNPMSRYPGRPA
jgi:predicted HAD superfamily Cof-like phosphohydrolase